MAKHLTDKQKKKIVAEYISCGNYREVARKYKVSDQTVKRIVNASPDITQNIAKKKEENTTDILNYLDSQVLSLKKLGDYILSDRLDVVKNKDVLDKISIMQLVTVYGVLTDKMLKSKEITSKIKTDNREVEDLTLLANLLKK